MKKYLTFIAAIAAGLLAPSVASAHTAQVSVRCQDGQEVGTYVFQSFPQNSTADEALWIDGVQAKYSRATGLGANPKTFTLSTPLPVDGKPHVLYASAAWQADGGGYSASTKVTCNGPTPTPTPTPTPSPTPTPTPPPPPVTPPVPTPTPVPPTVPPVPPHVVPPKKCPDTSNKRYRIVPSPKHLSHGLQTFHLYGPYVRHVRWYVDMNRQTHSRWRTISRDTRTFKVWLFDQSTFGHDLWGWHWITVQAAVGPKGCGHTASVKLKFFNNDPLL